MISVMPDWSFGNTGTLWANIPQEITNPFGDPELHLVGGTAIGTHRLADGSPALVVVSWKFVTSGNSYTIVRVVVFPADGQPREARRSDGTYLIDVSETHRHAEALASCTTSAGDVAVLIRQAPPQKPPPPWSWSYSIGTVHKLAGTAGHTIASRSLSPLWLHDTVGLPQPSCIRIAHDGADVGIASSIGTQVRVTRLRAAGTTPRDLDLAGAPALPGLRRLDVASVRFDAASASIALTAHLDHPVVGATSVGAILRVLADGSRDPSFGVGGLWVSPLALGQRDFVCAGETTSGVAGCVGRRALMFGILPDGSALDQGFGFGGVAEQDLGGPLASPVAASDAAGTCVFAQRVPSRTDPAGDLRAAGCRFSWSPASAGHGAAVAAFGDNGVVTVGCDGAAVGLAGLVLAGEQAFLGGTRQLHAADCDRVPFVQVMLAARGAPVATFGCGAICVQGSLAQPAVVAPDGSAVFMERVLVATGPAPALRFLAASGALAARVPLTSIPAGSVVSGLARLADGGLLLAGGGANAWVAKLDAAGAPVTSFGTAGVQTVSPGPGTGSARVVGVRASGDIVLRISVQAKDQLVVMHTDGQLDTAYGVNGFVEVESFNHPGAGTNGARCFLDADGSVIVVVSSEHSPADPFSGPVRVALRRVTPAGAYDASFGLGALSPSPPAAGRALSLYSPAGASSANEDYSSITPVGIAWLGGRLYVVATGWAGGAYVNQIGMNFRKPVYPLLLILAWTANGAVDASLAGTGLQEAGFYPDRRYWSALGLLQDSPTSFFVYGQAGDTETVSTSVGGGPPMQSTRVRQPQPALFRVEHPGGLDLTFDADGAATIRLPEVGLTTVAGSLLSGGRVRLACVDFLTQPQVDIPRTNQAALVQWRPGKVPPTPPRPPRPWPP